VAPGSVMAIARTIRTARPVPRASSAESPKLDFPQFHALGRHVITRKMSS
jgi:hypothetical protein